MSIIRIVAVCALALACLSASKAPISGEAMMKDVRVLAADDMQGRRVSTPGGEMARAYLVQRFKQVGLAPVGGLTVQSFDATADRHPGEVLHGANVLGMIKGRKHPDRFIVVSAHYDHLGVKNGQIYNGADDDASGVGALLALAQRLKAERPDHSVLFVAFDGEEAGGLGSEHFIAHPPVPLDALLVDVNLDMVGRGDKGELYVTGTRVNPTLRPIVEAAAAGVPIKVLFGHEDPADRNNDWTWQSDHWAFAQKQKPFLYFGVEDHPDYHRPTDDADKIPVAFYGSAATVILRTVQRLDKAL